MELGRALLRSDALLRNQSEHTVELDEKKERATVSFSEALPAKSTARLSIPFKGELTEDMLGYYRSTGGKDGELKYSLTQFEVAVYPF